MPRKKTRACMRPECRKARIALQLVDELRGRNDALQFALVRAANDNRRKTSELRAQRRLVEMLEAGMSNDELDLLYNDARRNLEAAWNRLRALRNSARHCHTEPCTWRADDSFALVTEGGCQCKCAGCELLRERVLFDGPLHTDDAEHRPTVQAEPALAGTVVGAGARTHNRNRDT
jgi:hypothetical protein